MKAVIISLVFAGALTAAAVTNDVVAIQAAISGATNIRATRTGYSVTTPSGTRTVYRTPTGYYIEGGHGEPNRQLIKTATGYRVESSATRGAAFSNHR